MRRTVVALGFSAAPALAQSRPDAQDRRAKIQESVRDYSGNCQRPDYSDSAGRKCGQRRGYTEPGGASPPWCEHDIPDAMREGRASRQR